MKQVTNRTSILIASIFFVLLSLSIFCGCSQKGQQQEATSVPTPTNSAPVIANIPLTATTSVSQSLGFSRTNPAPIGTTLTAQVTNDPIRGDYKFRIQLIEVIRGEEAWKIIHSEPFNDPPTPGTEYILTKIRIDYLESTKPDTQYDINRLLFTAVSEKGKDYDSTKLLDPEPTIFAKLYPGASSEGWITFQVNIDDSHPLLAYQKDYYGRGGVWYKLY